MNRLQTCFKPPNPDHRTTGGDRLIILYIMDIMEHWGGGRGEAVNAGAYIGFFMVSQN